MAKHTPSIMPIIIPVLIIVRFTPIWHFCRRGLPTCVGRACSRSAIHASMIALTYSQPLLHAPASSLSFSMVYRFSCVQSRKA